MHRQDTVKRTASWVIVGWFVVVTAFGAGVLPGLSAQATQQAPLDRAFLNTYCVTCHSERVKTAGLALDTADLSRGAEIWEKVARRVRSGTMPPGTAPRPDRASAVRFAADIEARLDQAAANAPNPGRPAVHRLNRAEYVNAIRDLLALEIEPDTFFPADESLDGFDNIGGVLSTSPALLERYLSAARRISRLAVGDSTIGPTFASKTYDAPQTVYQDVRMGEDFAFGTRGGLAIRHRFPLDGEYVCQIRLRKNIFGYTRGLGEAHQIEMRLDNMRIKLFPIGGDAPGAPAPLSFTGVLRGDPAWEAYSLSADAHLDVRFPASAGTRLVTVAFPDEITEDEGVQQPPLSGLGFSYDESRSAPTGPWGPAIDSVTIKGPFDATGSGETESRRRLFTCHPTGEADEVPCARRILSTVARRAYRRPISARDLDRLFSFFESARHERGFEEGIRAALERLLVDPNFLFRIERDPEHTKAGDSYRISDLELASRLSFFLWSSIPDDALLDAASADKLHGSAAVEAQVRRMLRDPRAGAMVDNFADQWLSLRRLRVQTPDPELFPEFDGNLRDAFATETNLFVSSQIRDDRSVLDLLTARYTFVNERLARHYGMADVHGSHFRRVAVNDAERIGILGHGSILTVTSYPTRTSPVLRGRWLLDTILGTPPPPPPPNIPALPDAGSPERPLSVRQRMEEHRKNPACAGCHARMDPLGFALEHFDAIGRWRDRSEVGSPVDASGLLPDGTSLDGIAGIRQYVSDHPDEFVRTVVEKLLTYALGRSIESYDMPAVRTIVREAEPGGFRWSAIVLGIARSVPFQMRKSAS